MAKYSEELKNAIVSGDFVRAAGLLDRIQEEGDSELYVNQVVELLYLVPAVTYGMPGPVMSFIESQDPSTYLDTLLRVAEEKPNEHCNWLLKRIIVCCDDACRRKCIDVLQKIATRTDIGRNVSDVAKEILSRYAFS